MTSPSQKLDDIRNVGIARVPDGSFLITGRPRIRSAWLAALLSSENFPVYHEAPLPKTPIDEDGAFGLIDPGAACLWPNRALRLFEASRAVIIERAEDEARASLERLVGQEVKNWAVLEERYQYFKAESGALVVPFESLQDFETLGHLVMYCTGEMLTRQRFELFDGLRIEQDFKKAQAREQAAA